MNDVSARDHLAQRIEAIADDRTSSASALLDAALGILRTAIAEGIPILPAARALANAQPSMASIWNAALEAVAQATEAGRLDRFAARVAEAPAALARHAREHFLLGPVGPLRVVTLSSSASVRTVLDAVSADREVRVSCAEGRPGLEGRAFASGLAQAGIPVTVFADAALGHALAGADAVILGADAVAPEWFINKSGSYMLAALAARQGVPVYVAAARDKFVGHELAGVIPVLDQPGAEVWDGAPGGVAVRNLYFERTPLDLVTGVISDVGFLGVDMVPDACRATQDEAALAALHDLTDDE